MTFLDLGSSRSFYDKISKRPNEAGLRHFYMKFVAIISTIGIIIFTLSILGGFQSKIWPDQTLDTIVMGLIFGFLYWYSQIVLKIIDAYALTKQGEIVRILQKFLRIVLILPMYLFGLFDVFDVFILFI